VFFRGTRGARGCDARAVDRPRRREARERGERVRDTKGTRVSPRRRGRACECRTRAFAARVCATRNSERLEAIGETEAVVVSNTG
jgi:hypothetical protein